MVWDELKKGARIGYFKEYPNFYSIPFLFSFFSISFPTFDFSKIYVPLALFDTSTTSIRDFFFLKCYLILQNKYENLIYFGPHGFKTYLLG